jgi:hypothetical protein
MVIQPALTNLVEGLTTSLPLKPEDVRIENSAWIAVLRSGGDHPVQAVVRPLTFAEDVPATLQSVRDTLCRHDRRRAMWMVGPSASPPDLQQQLLAAGLKRYRDPTCVGMVLRNAPRDSESVVHARRAETVADYVLAFQIMNTVFAERTETAAERLERAEQSLELDRAGRGALFLGVLKGEVVAAAKSIYLPEAIALVGGCTLPHARGHGAYRSLVMARYLDAARRGIPLLAVHAGAMSRPILTRLGFEAVVEIAVLVDEWDSVPA